MFEPRICLTPQGISGSVFKRVASTPSTFISASLIEIQNRLFVQTRQFIHSCDTTMARGMEGDEISSRKPKPALSSQPSTAQKSQKTLLGFFQQKPQAAASTRSSISLTPAPSSDPVETPTPPKHLPVRSSGNGKNKENGLPSPITPATSFVADAGVKQEINGTAVSSPSRKVCSINAGIRSG